MDNAIGQIRFITTFDNPINISEYPDRAIEIKDGYLIPILEFPIDSAEKDKFYIAKVDKSGKVVNRKLFGDWVQDGGPLFNANGSDIWKISSDYDTTDLRFHFRFCQYDSNLNQKLDIKIPRTFPNNGQIYLEEYAYVRLTNGDFIFMLGVFANDWYPYGRNETYGCNFIYITKDGKIKANKTTNMHHLPKYIWQLNDTSIVFDAQLNGCQFGNCRAIKVLDFNGNEVKSKVCENTRIFQKKCGNRFYSFVEFNHQEIKMVCYDENFDSLYEKKLPDDVESMRPLQFWDSRDNNDMRLRLRYRNFSKSYETMTDTSFTWEKWKLFTGESDDSVKGIIDVETDIKFYPTSDGGALYVCNKHIEDSEFDLVVVKVDTVKWKDTAGHIDALEIQKFIIHPNPNSGNFLNIEAKAWQKIIIYDAIGKKRLDFDNNATNPVHNLDITHLLPGKYYLQIKYPGKTVYNKLIRL